MTAAGPCRPPRERKESASLITRSRNEPTVKEPTDGMKADAASAGFYESPNGRKYPRIQLLTIEGLLNKTQRAEHPDYEPDLNFKKPKSEPSSKQEGLTL
jgi:hypothetical protein